MANIWHQMPIERITPDRFMAIVEIPKGSKIKYELDKETGLIMVDRILYTSTIYPANYGFIPKTYADDNDPLDVVIMCSEPLIPRCEIECYPIGVISMIDSGESDDKIIAVPFNEPNYNCYRDISALPSHVFTEMCHFFKVYKSLEGKETAVDSIKGCNEARDIIRRSIECYKEKFPEITQEEIDD